MNPTLSRLDSLRIIHLFYTETKQKDAHVLQTLSLDTSLKIQYNEESKLYQVEKTNRFTEEPTEEKVLGNNIVQVIAKILFSQGEEVIQIQHNPDSPFVQRRRVIRDHKGKPATKYSHELGKPQRQYETYHRGCYDILATP